MNWRVKGVIQGVLSAMPGGLRMNDFLQRTMGGLRNFEANVDSKVTGDWLVFASYLQELGVDPVDKDFLEIGTGWFPTLPVCFYLVGARSCQSFDLHRHLDWGMTSRMLPRLKVHLPAIAEASGQGVDAISARYDELLRCRTLDDFLRTAKIRYSAPADARQTGLPEGSVDIAFSNSVLEHVPADVIAGLMHEIRRVLRPGGLAMHGANCGDHYAYFDKSITMLNYLTYPEDKWAMWNNGLLFQNRLRPCDFVRLTEAAELETVFVRAAPSPQLLETLPKVKLAPEFSDYAPEELCATSVGLVSRAN
jgi:SAM-dependent methyltransferase